MHQGEVFLAALGHYLNLNWDHSVSEEAFLLNSS